MSVALQWFLVLTAVVAALLVLAAAVGLALPKRHRASVSARIPGSREDVWAAIADPEGYPGWRPDVHEVRVLEAGEAGVVRWVERSRVGSITLEVVGRAPPARLETRIDDEDLPFGGTWRLELEPVGPDETRVTVTEHGEIHSPIFRFVARFALGYEARMRDFLEGLEDRFVADRSASGGAGAPS